MDVGDSEEHSFPSEVLKVRQHVLPKRRCLSIKPYGVTNRKSNIDVTLERFCPPMERDSSSGTILEVY